MYWSIKKHTSHHHRLLSKLISPSNKHLTFTCVSRYKLSLPSGQCFSQVLRHWHLELDLEKQPLAIAREAGRCAILFNAIYWVLPPLGPLLDMWIDKWSRASPSGACNRERQTGKQLNTLLIQRNPSELWWHWHSLTKGNVGVTHISEVSKTRWYVSRVLQYK